MHKVSVTGRSWRMDEDLKLFEDRYATGVIPWDSGVPDQELVRLLDAGKLPGKTVLEIGCGTGTNAVEFARRGCEVTAVDFVEKAILTARDKAKRAGVNVDWRMGDATAIQTGGTYDLLFDRGVYHHLRTTKLGDFQEMLRRVTRAGSRWLSLAGNSKEEHDPGPPTVSEADIRSELGPLFEILELNEYRFGTENEKSGPLAWSILMQRKG